ncbi:MAG TPA: IS66 family transposase [Polyangiaceae bacterium]|nr:IS66 family transposase [Polyangiaceae bacterium]
MKLTAERDKLRRAYEQVKEQLELLRRRLYVAKAERVDTTQLQLEFAETQARLHALATQLEEGAPPSETLDAPADAVQAPADPPADAKPRSKPAGRRDLRSEEMPEERVEILNPALEGVVERIGFEESFKLGYRRAGRVRLVLARATYKSQPVPEANRRENEPAFTIVTAPMPKELFPRGLLAPSMIAHVLVQKYRWGLPFHRQSRMLAAEGCKLDDSVMCRYAEDAGATLGCIVDACAEEAKRQAFCLSTDATGVCIQPEPLAGRQRQACRKGHFFVVLADKDHVFFEYQPKHTSAAVCEMFRGFSGYIQADAHAIYDAIFRGEAQAHDDDTPPKEVGCWSHCRRKAWEAAVVAKDPAAREALLRMRALFKLEEDWAALAPAQRHARRQLASRPLVDDFFAWIAAQYALVKNTRGLVATAFGYAVRQETALRRFLDDGRLPMTNNHSERALRSIAVGRRAWLFFGSDDHASAAANLFSLIASCELHGLDPEAYLLDIIHVLPYWPRTRYLELAPKYWAATRARIPENQLAVEIGDITVPPPLPPQEQPVSR